MKDRAARRGLIGLVALALVLLGLPSPATAATGVALVGEGYGHGIGMSQYGARYRAEAGHTYSQILAAYYPGTTLAGGSDSDKIRVRVESDTDNITAVRAEPGLRIRTSGGITTLPTTVAGGTPTQWRLRIGSGALVLQALVGGTWRSSGSSTVTELLAGRSYADFTSTDGSVRLVLGSVDREYLGAVRGVRPSGTSSTLRTVVVSRMTNYLASVVSAEMPSIWAANALRAQAVAARTYAKFDAASKPAGSYYDTCDTTSCQVFNGRAHYTGTGSLITTWAVATTTAATTATAGRYLQYQGAPAFTQFSASNGGYSVAGSRPYLRAAADSFDRYPSWQVTLSTSAIQQAYPSIGRFTGLSITRDGNGAYGGRATSVRIIGTSGSTSVTGAQFRSAFGLRSTLFGLPGTGPAMSDVDGDDHADLIGVGPSGRVYLWRGDGDALGSRTQLGGTWADKTPVAVTHGMVASSSYPEVLYVEDGTGDLLAYPVTPSLTLGQRGRLHTGDWTRYDTFIGVVDFGGNGRPGFLARGTATGKLYYFESDGAGGLSPRRLVSGWGPSAAVVAIASAGDWDGDGIPDIVVLGASGTLWLYPGTGSGNLDPRAALSSRPGWSARIDLIGGADWDQNGSLDLISVDRSGQLMLNAASGSDGVATGRRLTTGWTYDLLS